MLKFGKLQNVQKKKINYFVRTLESTQFEDGKTISKMKRPELEIQIEVQIENDKYYFNFFIQKPFDEYLKLKNYDKESIDRSYIIEDFANINNDYESFPYLYIQVLRLTKSLVFNIDIKSVNDEYFLTSEFEIPIITIEEALNKISYN